MNTALLKSILRHLLGAVLAAVGALLATHDPLTWTIVATTIGAAAIPVVIKYIDPTSPSFGIGSNRHPVAVSVTTALPTDSGQVTLPMIMVVCAATLVGVILLLLGYGVNVHR